MLIVLPCDPSLAEPRPTHVAATLTPFPRCEPRRNESADSSLADRVLWASVGFGQTTDTIGGTAAQAGNQTGLIVWEPITASHSGALNTIGINIPMGFVAGHVVLAIYAASGGPPGTPTGTPLATTTSTLVVAGWMDLATTAFNIVAGTPYFLDQFDNTSGVVNLDSSGTEYYQAQAMYGTWAAPLESIKCKQRCKICE